MKKDCFKTARLVVENWRPLLACPPSREVLMEDLTSILTRNVMQHLPEVLHVGQERDAIVQWIAARNAEAEVLTVRDRKRSTLLGLLILAEMPEEDGSRSVHLGYFLAEDAWGKGYATELVSGLVEYQKSRGSVSSIRGGVGIDNKASARVLEKAGFTKSDRLSTGDTEIFVREMP
ncbi:MAG: GNAT family N-acetyltransferase [Alphaproteobacteria bacterium]|nr:GNAT family N-acetyltransferase [Alphaproteobacteria bacterium]